MKARVGRLGDWHDLPRWQEYSTTARTLKRMRQGDILDFQTIELFKLHLKWSPSIGELDRKYGVPGNSSWLRRRAEWLGIRHEEYQQCLDNYRVSRDVLFERQIRGGCTSQQIANHMDRSLAWVRAKAVELGLNPLLKRNNQRKHRMKRGSSERVQKRREKVRELMEQGIGPRVGARMLGVSEATYYLDKAHVERSSLCNGPLGLLL